MFYSLPNFLKPIVKTLVRLFVSKRMAEALNNIKTFTSEEIDEAFVQKMTFEKEFSQRWREEKLDGLICPSFFHSSFKTND